MKRALFLTALFLSGCAASSNPPTTPVIVTGPPVPARVRAEADRPPVTIPRKALGLRESRALALQIRQSELRYRRAARDAITHHDATQPKVD